MSEFFDYDLLRLSEYLACIEVVFRKIWKREWIIIS